MSSVVVKGARQTTFYSPLTGFFLVIYKIITRPIFNKFHTLELLESFKVNLPKIFSLLVFLTVQKRLHKYHLCSEMLECYDLIFI